MKRFRNVRPGPVGVLIALAIGAVGCSATSVDPSQQRRERFREELRQSLGDRYDAPLPAITPEEIRRGAALYEALCRSCHGPRGRGNGKSAQILKIRPPDLSDPRAAAFFSNQARLKIIAEGIPGTPMIGWDRMLNESDRIAVLHFMNGLVRMKPSP